MPDGNLITESVETVRELTGDVPVAMKRCVCCALEWQTSASYFTVSPDKRPGRRARLHSYCRACHSRKGGMEPHQRLRRGDVTLAWCQQNAIDFFARRNLGLPTHNIDQTDISVEVYKRGGDPGGMRQKLQTADVVTADEVAARRQARFEAASDAQREPRQQRRARERRLAKDARQVITRTLTDAEVTAIAIDRSMAARSRARGGATAVRRQRKRVTWKLEPGEVSDLLKAQGYLCALSGEPFKESTEYGTTNPFGPSPNRINPGGDYTASNCEFVCWWINRLIGDMPRERALEFLAERKLLRKGVGQMSLL